jgi:hypothetical protein
MLQTTRHMMVLVRVQLCPQTAGMGISRQHLLAASVQIYLSRVLPVSRVLPEKWHEGALKSGVRVLTKVA